VITAERLLLPALAEKIFVALRATPWCAKMAAGRLSYGWLTK
jgi:hypothetical protein